MSKVLCTIGVRRRNCGWPRHRRNCHRRNFRLNCGWHRRRCRSLRHNYRLNCGWGRNNSRRRNCGWAQSNCPRKNCDRRNNFRMKNRCWAPTCGNSRWMRGSKRLRIRKLTRRVRPMKPDGLPMHGHRRMLRGWPWKRCGRQWKGSVWKAAGNLLRRRQSSRRQPYGRPWRPWRPKSQDSPKPQRRMLRCGLHVLRLHGD